MISADPASQSVNEDGRALVYVVEDDEALRAELIRLLDLQGFATAWTDSFPTAHESAVAARPDCVVLDLKLPDADGLEICRAIRAQSAVPIIMLTSSESEFDEVMALGLGADDYVTKPYRPAALIARIKGALRRGAQAAVSVISHRGVELDEAAAAISFEGRHAELSRNELRILSLLMRNAGHVVTRQQLMLHLWESDEFIDDNTLTVNVNRLRRSLSALGVPEDYIKTRRGIGYLL